MKMMKTYKRTSYTNGLDIFSKDKDLLKNLMQLPQIFDFRKVHVFLYDVYDGKLIKTCMYMSKTTSSITNSN